MKLKRLIVAMVIASAGIGYGQRCALELESTLVALGPKTAASVVAAELLADAVRWVEPALPPLMWSVDVPLRPGDPGYGAVRYLAERGLLPGTWTPEELTVETWQEMLSRFLGWYRLEPEGGQAAGNDLVGELALTLERIGEAVRPLALVASDSQDRSRVAFLGVVWNWTIYPRLIVRRPGPEQDLSNGVQPLLDQLGNCAVEFEHYVFAPEDTARRLFLTHSDARMYVIGSDPQLAAWPMLVPDGEEEEYFSFASPQVSQLVSYAAAFEGPQLGIRSLMAMMPRLRTNLPPTRIPGLLSTPERQ